MKFNPLERDFIEFIAGKRNISIEQVEQTFFQIREKFKFIGKDFDRFNNNIHKFFSLLHDAKDESSALESYQFFDLVHTLVYVSYTYPKKTSKNIADAIKFIKKGDWQSLVYFAKRKLSNKAKEMGSKNVTKNSILAQSLFEKIDKTPVVVDYGCGLGFVSFEIAQMDKNTKVYLCDIECLHLEFTEYRFKKHGIDTEVIKVTSDNLYPKLPKHNICIATEVMEHVFEPLALYQNINNALDPKGILHGNFSDHTKGMFHVSPNLKDLRETVKQDFEQLDPLTYRKK